MCISAWLCVILYFTLYFCINFLCISCSFLLASLGNEIRHSTCVQGKYCSLFLFSTSFTCLSSLRIVPHHDTPSNGASAREENQWNRAGRTSGKGAGRKRRRKSGNPIFLSPCLLAFPLIFEGVSYFLMTGHTTTTCHSLVKSYSLSHILTDPGYIQ